MRVTCKRGDYAIYVGCFNIPRGEELLSVENYFHAHEYLIRGPQGLFAESSREYIVVARLMLPAQALASTKCEQPLPEYLRPYVLVPSPLDGYWSQQQARANSFLGTIAELEVSMLQVYLETTADIVLNPQRYRGYRTVARRSHGKTSFNYDYIIKSYEEGLLVSLVQQHATRYKIAEALAKGATWELA